SELGALTALFARADAPVVERAVSAAGGMSPLAGCSDMRALATRARVPDDATTRAKVSAISSRVNEAKALRAAGRYKEGLQVAGKAADDARALGFAPLTGAALRQLA